MKIEILENNELSPRQRQLWIKVDGKGPVSFIADARDSYGLGPTIQRMLREGRTELEIEAPPGVTDVQ